MNVNATEIVLLAVSLAAAWGTALSLVETRHSLHWAETHPTSVAMRFIAHSHLRRDALRLLSSLLLLVAAIVIVALPDGLPETFALMLREAREVRNLTLLSQGLVLLVSSAWDLWDRRVIRHLPE